MTKKQVDQVVQDLAPLRLKEPTLPELVNAMLLLDGVLESPAKKAYLDQTPLVKNKFYEHLVSIHLKSIEKDIKHGESRIKSLNDLKAIPGVNDFLASRPDINAALFNLTGKLLEIEMKRNRAGSEPKPIMRNPQQRSPMQFGQTFFTSKEEISRLRLNEQRNKQNKKPVAETNSEQREDVRPPCKKP